MNEPESTFYIGERGRAELVATADAHFDCVIGELRQMRDRFVEAGDHAAIECLAQNLEVETF